MLKLEYLSTLPVNFPEVVDEIANALAALYGPMTGVWYKEIAPRAMQENIRQPHVKVLGIMDRTTLAAFLVSIHRREVEHISFVHVLERYAGHGLEQRLVRHHINQCRKQNNMKGILAEYVALCALDLDKTYQKLQFEHVARALMHAKTEALSNRVKEDIQSYPAPEEEFSDIAAIIVDAYKNHPGQRLHVEVQNNLNALDYTRQVAAGDFGSIENGFLRLMRRDGIPIATILGCGTVPDYGFILQVAVREAWQGQGLGAQLIHTLATEFQKAGFSNMALGVTLSNPAIHLYQRIGFEILRNVDAYVWWRP